MIRAFIYTTAITLVAILALEKFWQLQETDPVQGNVVLGIWGVAILVLAGTVDKRKKTDRR